MASTFSNSSGAKPSLCAHLLRARDTFCPWLHRLKRSRQLPAVWLLLALCSACNRAPCGGLHEPSKGKFSPRLVGVNALPQSSIDPYSLILELLFFAPHADVNEGSLDIYVGASTPIVLPLAPYFGPSNLNPNATTGRLAVPLTFAQSALQDDSLLRIGVQLRDGSAFYSNCVTLEMHYLVDPLALLPHLSRPRVLYGCQSRALVATNAAAFWPGNAKASGQQQEARHVER